MGAQFNYNKLRGRIVEKLGSQTALATQMGISAITLTQKLKNRVAFKNDEILHMARILDIPPNDIPVYFFCNED